MRRTVVTVAIMATLVAGVASIAAAAATPEVRPFVGAFIPTGDQRDILNDALLVGTQGGVELAERVHVVGSVAYAPRKASKEASVYQYDVGVETFRPYRMTERWQMRPFVGAGLGGRTYVDNANNDHKETIFAGYGAMGAEFQLDRFALRLEGRDYLTRFKGLDGNQSGEYRNDVTIMSGLVVHW